MSLHNTKLHPQKTPTNTHTQPKTNQSEPKRQSIKKNAVNPEMNASTSLSPPSPHLHSTRTSPKRGDPPRIASDANHLQTSHEALMKRFPGDSPAETGLHRRDDQSISRSSSSSCPCKTAKSSDYMVPQRLLARSLSHKLPITLRASRNFTKTP
ncbi:hypothetical protein KC19_2G015600 [Ceratodon purpureus]|uniref:Uncharacterized protein n=1 Tax=Ceratodon purpureus TaxID=3225 RepID=A0A8T0IS49_CERPU|nr:hypothetical protein KC19_2G015600 [Ceratodon purpureus]